MFTRGDQEAEPPKYCTSPIAALRAAATRKPACRPRAMSGTRPEATATRQGTAPATGASHSGALRSRGIRRQGRPVVCSERAQGFEDFVDPDPLHAAHRLRRVFEAEIEEFAVGPGRGRHGDAAAAD